MYCARARSLLVQRASLSTSSTSQRVHSSYVRGRAALISCASANWYMATWSEECEVCRSNASPVCIYIRTWPFGRYIDHPTSLLYGYCLV